MYFFFLDYELFSIMLTGRSLQSHQKMFFSSQLTRLDVKEATNAFNRMDDVVDILKSLPSSMILVFRYILYVCGSLLMCTMVCTCHCLLSCTCTFYTLELAGSSDCCKKTQTYLRGKKGIIICSCFWNVVAQPDRSVLIKSIIVIRLFMCLMFM